MHGSLRENAVVSSKLKKNKDINVILRKKNILYLRRHVKDLKLDQAL